MNTGISFLIIVPTFNSYLELPRLCKSILDQTFQNWRVIFIDADSCREHKKWLEDISKNDKRFLVKNEPRDNRGIYPSMSFGYTFANKTDWVIFLGSDDWFSLENVLEKLANKISFFEKHESIDLVIYESQYLNKENNKIIRKNHVPKLKSADKLLFSKLIFFGYIPPHQSVCFSLKLLKKLMPYSKNYLLASDCDLFLRMNKLKNLKIIFMKTNLINIQTGGISSVFLFKRIKEVLKIYFRYYNYFYLIPFILRYFRKAYSRLVS